MQFSEKNALRSSRYDSAVETSLLAQQSKLNLLCITKPKDSSGLMRTEVGDQCFCGSSLEYVRPITESKCDYPCTGNNTQMCGGYGYMSFFSKIDQDPRISAGLMDPPSTSTVSRPSSTTGSASNTDIPPPADASQSSPSIETAKGGMSTESSLAATITNSQEPGFTLPPDITSSPAFTQTLPPQSLNTGSVFVNGQKVSGNSRQSSGPIRISPSESTQEIISGQPKLKDGPNAIIFGQVGYSRSYDEQLTAVCFRLYENVLFPLVSQYQFNFSLLGSD